MSRNQDLQAERLARLTPSNALQVAQRSCVLVLVLVLEEVQTKPVVSLLFFLWNLVELLR